jgi:ABC-type dipeptide/oligopeptide/nickel transport system permease subunit
MVALTLSKPARWMQIFVAVLSDTIIIRKIAGARLTLDKDPLLVVWPSAVLGLAILSFNVLGDALRDILDPRVRGSH